MPQPARVLEGADVRRLLRHVRDHRHATRNHVMVLLSFKAGLRACEMAGLDWSMVLRPDGQLDRCLSVSRHIAKNGSGRRVPVHPELKVALLRLHAAQARPAAGAVLRSERGSHMRPRSIVNWFGQAYAELGFAGHRSLTTTERYIQGDRDAQRKLVRLI